MRLESEGSTSREIKSLQTRTKNHKTQEEKHARLKFPIDFTCARARKLVVWAAVPAHRALPSILSGHRMLRFMIFSTVFISSPGV